MVYNLTTPVTAARFSAVPHQRSKYSTPYWEGLKAGEEEAKSDIASLTIGEIRAKYREAKKNLKGHRDRSAELQKEYDHLTGTIVAHEDLDKWAGGFLRFEAPTGKAFPSFRDSIADEEIHDLYNIKNPPKIDEYQDEIFAEASNFIIEHNWLSAISKADEFASGSFRLPFDICIFEFKISGKQTIAICTNYASDGSDNEIVLQLAVESLTGWAISPNIYKHAGGEWGIFNNGRSATDDVKYLRLVRLVGDQIRAACIALDADVATTTLVRAIHAGHEMEPHEHPEYEYHTISLANRQRAEALASHGETKGIRRLHFRRGHWRHYLTSKTWVRWCLVGNPELGFIDKQYRL